MGERQFGPYRLVRQIAVGGMAEIYLAKTRGIAGFEKYVALKMIHPNFSEDQQFIQMLIDEAKITVLLQHVNVAQTFDLGRVGTTYYITMEYVDGADMYTLLRRGSELELDVPIDVAAHIAKEVATGLDYAHRKRDISGKKINIVHRDVSPQNVLISFNGEVKLVDFGIAKASMRARQTAAGVIKGKYYYMSPEQAWGEPVDHRTDIFSTGILLYEALTGQMLYLEEDLHKLLDMVRRAEIAPPSSLRAGIPPQLEQIAMRALAKDRDDRYVSASDMATDIDRFLHAFSPVFRSPKVSEWVNEVMATEIAGVEVEPTDPSSRGSLSGDLLVRERSEITDENSMIYRLQDLKPPDDPSAESGSGSQGAPAGPADGGFPGAEHSRSATMDPLPKLSVRAIDEETKNVAADVDQLLGAGARPGDGASRGPLSDLPATRLAETVTPRPGELVAQQQADALVPGGDFDEHTVVSEAPNFAAPLLPVNPFGRSADEESDDRTVVEPPPEGSVDNGRSHYTAKRAETGPTLRGESRAPSASGDRTADGRLPRPRPKSVPPPLPPAALSARNPKPAVSSVRPPRRSRRTPAEGNPIGNSVLSKIVGQEPPHAIAGTPVVRAPANLDPTDDNELTLQRPPRSVVPQRPQGAAIPGQPGPEPQVPGRVVIGPPLDTAQAGRLVDGPTWPFDPAQVAPQPYGQLPPGAPPLSTANRLVALELDEIPSAFKLGEQSSRRRKRAFVVVAALLLFTLLGVVMGVILFRGEPEAPSSKTIEVVSIPSGAAVTIDGKPIAGKTPLQYGGVAIGTRYAIGVTLADHKPWSSEAEVSAGGAPVVKVIARLDPVVVTLTVDSRPSGAEVLLNGSPVGTTPLRLRELDPRSSETIELRLKGHRPIRQALDWSDDTAKALNFQLKK